MTEKVPSCFCRFPVNLAVPGYLVLCLALPALRLEAAQFRVIGPDRPVTAPLRGEAILPFHLSPEMSAEDMEVRWFRSQFSAVVHLYRNGQDQYGEQIPDYQGRTELLKDDIASGKVSLRIRDIRPSDDGEYKCLFQSRVFFEEATLELQVAGLGSAPDISMEGHQDGGIRVVCRSSGWYPEPQVLWRDLQGQVFPIDSVKITPEASGLFQTEIAMVITEESNQKVSCCVRNPRDNQERESVIFITDLFYPWFSPWMLAFSGILGVMLGVLIALTFCSRRQHRLKAAHQAEKDKLQEELRWRCAQLCAADVTLDPDTAHLNLVVSVDGKSVTYEDTQQDRPDNPERFRTYPVVLGTRIFTSGRFYWEVEIGDKTSWTVGVCREPAIRTGKVKLTPGNGYWTVWLKNGKYEACTSPPTPFPTGVRPRQVGVFLDYEAGEVSFYSVTDGSHLFTFTDTFSGKLRPYFYTGYKEGGKNAAPLSICPVSAQAGEHHGP